MDERERARRVLYQTLMTYFSMHQMTKAECTVAGLRLVHMGVSGNEGDSLPKDFSVQSGPRQLVIRFIEQVPTPDFIFTPYDKAKMLGVADALADEVEAHGYEETLGYADYILIGMAVVASVGMARCIRDKYAFTLSDGAVQYVVEVFAPLSPESTLIDLY